MKKCDKNFGIEIKQLRELQDIKQKDLAARANIRPSDLCRVEQGKQCLKEELARRVINAVTDVPVTRRRLLQLAGIATTAHRLTGTGDWSTKPVDGWQRWLDEGDEATRQKRHADARRSYRAAAQCAKAVGEKSVWAFALAQSAQAGCELNDLSTVEAEAREALKILNLPRELEPINFPAAAVPGSPQACEFTKRLFRELADDLASQTYLVVAKAQGRSWQQRGKSHYTHADSAFAALSVGGIMRGDRRIEAEGYHFLGQNAIRKGTDLAPGTTKEWRAEADPAELLLGHGFFGMARSVRPKDDYIGLGYDCRGQATILHIQGKDDTATARRATAQARELLAGGQGWVSLLLDEGRRFRSADDDVEAARVFQEAMGLAYTFANPFLFADAASKLAEIADQADHNADALTYAAAAAVAWPTESYRGDYRRVEQLFQRLISTYTKKKDEVRNVLTGQNFPFGLLREMPGFDQNDAVRILERLANVR